MEKFFQIFQDLYFNISFADALLLMPKFASMIKSLLTNKDKLFELAKIPLNENWSAMLLKKLPKKLGDLGKFLIPYLKQGEVVKEKYSIEEPPELELKDLPSHLEYAYLEDFMGPFSSSRGNRYILVAVDYLSKWVEAKALPSNDARGVVKFLKSLFARFRTPRAIISDRGTYFCNDKFAKCMRTRNSYFPNNSSVTISRRRYKRRTSNVVEPDLRTIVEMADNRTMKELLQAPTEGYGEAIVILEINANHFEIKMNLLQLVQANLYHGFERENPHTHISNFKRITSTLKFRDLPNDVIKLMMFPYSLEGNARVWRHLERNGNDLRKYLERGNLLSKTTREALQIIENKSKVCYSRNKPNVSRMNTNSRDNASKSDERNDKLADQISTLVDIFAKKIVTPATVKAIEESCVTCGGAHAYYNCPNTDCNQPSVCAATGTYNQVAPQNCASTYMAPPGFAPMQNEPYVPKNLPKPNIPYPSRLNDQKLREKATNQMEKFFQMFEDFHFDISFADALILMPKFTSTIKSLLTNKDKFFELAKIPLNENCSAMLLKKLFEKLGDPGKFLIPCDFLGMDVCHALTNLSASINLMPLSIWEKLSLPELTPTWMTLELADRSITHPKGVAEDVFVNAGKFHFPTNFVVVDFKADPRVPLILGRSFLRTGRALIDVYGEEITLRVNDEAVTFNLNQTTRYSSTYDDLLINRIDIIDVASEEYAGFKEIRSHYCMRTRNSYFLNNSSATIPRRRNKRRTSNVVEPELRTIVEMADNRTMEELLQAPTKGYGEAVVILEINADHFEIKTNLLQLVQKVVTPAPVKAVEESCVTCGGTHACYNCSNTDSNKPSVCVATGEFKNEIQNTMKTQQTVLMEQQNAFQNNLQNMLNGFFQNQASTSGTLPSNTIPNPKGEMKAITTRSDVAYKGPSIPTPKKVVEQETKETTDKEQSNFQGSTAHIQPPVIPIPEPDVPKTLPKPNIPYHSRLNDQKLREKATNQMEKFFQIFQDLHFDISFADALILMPKFASMIKSLLTNKDKLFELAKMPLNENFSSMLLKKLPEKLGDPGKFFIPCDFLGMD
nr:reverse transcriptase domain-containing protein [Tanacetum cinerariifolium]